MSPDESNPTEEDNTMAPPAPASEPTSPRIGNRIRQAVRTISMESGITEAPRLVKRNRPYHQSLDIMNVHNKYGKHRWTLLRNFLWHDWFHMLMRMSTSLSLLLILTLWVSFIMMFAVIYMAIDARDPTVECGLGFDNYPIQIYGAFAFSLETCTTVGYGLPGDTMTFFENCPDVQVAIFFQMMFSMCFNALLLSLLFTRISRAESRSAQILFTDKAVIRKDDKGRLLFKIKVYDADSKYPLVESHVRLYVVHSCSNRNYHPLRITVPDDDLGATLLTSIPSTIVHHIDNYSQLLPPKFRGRNHMVESCGLQLREIDSHTGNREVILCPVCAECYGTHERLLKHIRFNQEQERLCEFPVEGTHQELSEKEVSILTEPEKHYPQPTFEDLKYYFESAKIEIIAVVESIDPLVSGTCSALQSYQSDDIVLDRDFVPAWDSSNQVDLDLFHETVETEKIDLKSTRKRGIKRFESSYLA